MDVARTCLSFGVLLLAGVAGVGPLLVVLCGGALLGTVIAAVHHAEVIAHRVGEPFGTLVLALAVTVIEASLILSMMIAGGDEMATLPRDTIYAATMIICNGVVGVCLLVGGLAHREQTFRVEGAGAGMAAIVAMSVLTLALPAFTTTTPRRHVQYVAAFVSGGDVGRVFVGGVRVHSDHFPSRLFHFGVNAGREDQHLRIRPRRARRGSVSRYWCSHWSRSLDLPKCCLPPSKPRLIRPAHRAR